MPDRVLGDLDHDRLAGLQRGLDPLGLALQAAGVEVHLARVQHGVAALADVDERGLHRRQHVLHLAEVHVADVGLVAGPVHVVLDQHAVFQHRDLGAVVVLADHHDPVHGLAPGQELRLGDDRRAAPAGLAALAPPLPLGLQPGGPADRLDVARRRAVRGPRRCARGSPCSAGRRVLCVPSASADPLRRRRRRRRPLGDDSSPSPPASPSSSPSAAGPSPESAPASPSASAAGLAWALVSSPSRLAVSSPPPPPPLPRRRRRLRELPGSPSPSSPSAEPDRGALSARSARSARSRPVGTVARSARSARSAPSSPPDAGAALRAGAGAAARSGAWKITTGAWKAATGTAGGGAGRGGRLGRGHGRRHDHRRHAPGRTARRPEPAEPPEPVAAQRAPLPPAGGPPASRLTAARGASRALAGLASRQARRRPAPSRCPPGCPRNLRHGGRLAHRTAGPPEQPAAAASGFPGRSRGRFC